MPESHAPNAVDPAESCVPAACTRTSVLNAAARTEMRASSGSATGSSKVRYRERCPKDSATAAFVVGHALRS